MTVEMTVDLVDVVAVAVVDTTETATAVATVTVVVAVAATDVVDVVVTWAIHHRTATAWTAVEITAMVAVAEDVNTTATAAEVVVAQVVMVVATAAGTREARVARIRDTTRARGVAAGETRAAGVTSSNSGQVSGASMGNRATTTRDRGHSSPQTNNGKTITNSRATAKVSRTMASKVTADTEVTDTGLVVRSRATRNSKQAENSRSRDL